jgi:hypothetical protein
MRILLSTASMLALLAGAPMVAADSRDAAATATDQAAGAAQAQDQAGDAAQAQGQTDDDADWTPLVAAGGDATVRVASVDPAGMSFETAAGETVMLGDGVSLEGIEPGSEVTISYHAEGPAWLATSVRPIDPAAGTAPGVGDSPAGAIQPGAAPGGPTTPQ